MPRCLTLPLSLAGLWLVLLLFGCGDASDLDVAAGRYRLQIHGAVTDTLTGPAVLRSARDTRVGLELGTRDGPGLSMEFTPRGTEGASDAATGRYEVMRAVLLNAPRTDSLPGFVAFLALPNAHFEATEGHFSVTHARSGAVGGTLDLRMQERSPSTGPPRTVRVAGTLWATSP